MGFSVIIPVFNEEQGIGAVLNSLIKILEDFGKPYEIIIVNDGSTDGTKDEAKIPSGPVRVIDHPRNMGYGASLKTGIKRSKYDLIVIMDGDGTYPNEKIPELVTIAEAESHDMVIGARTGSKVQIPLIRKPAKWLINQLAFYLTGVKIPDLNSGLRVINKTVLKNFVKILPDGFSFTSTITIAMLIKGYSVKFHPIDYFKRKGKSKIKPIQDTFNFIQLIIRTVLYFNPLKIFIPLSFSLALLSLLILFGSWYFFGVAWDVTFGVILMTSVIVLVIGMLADLIDKKVQ